MKIAKETLKKVLGVFLIIIGVIALVTPLTPGSWLAIIGLELLGLRYIFQEKISHFYKTWIRKKDADQSGLQATEENKDS